MYWPHKTEKEFDPNVLCAGEMSSSFILQPSGNLNVCRESLRRASKAACILCVTWLVIPEHIYSIEVSKSYRLCQEFPLALKV